MPRIESNILSRQDLILTIVKECTTISNTRLTLTGDVIGDEVRKMNVNIHTEG